MAKQAKIRNSLENFKHCILGVADVILKGHPTKLLDKQGTYKVTDSKCNDRHVYQHQDSSAYLFYSGCSWSVGPQSGTTGGWLQALDNAFHPHKVKAVWQMCDGNSLTDAPTIKARTGKAYATYCPDVILKGHPTEWLDKQGTYKVTELECHGRPVYQHEVSSAYLFYCGLSWMVGPQWGDKEGWLKAVDAAIYPHKVKAVWQILDGNSWTDAPTIKARNGKAYTIASCRDVILKGDPTKYLHKQGTYNMTDHECCGRPVYQHENGSAYLFYSQPAWFVCSRWGIKKGWLKAVDAATYPHNVKAVWQIADGKGGWSDVPTIKARTGKVYNTYCEDVILTRFMKQGPYNVTDHECCGRPVYQQEGSQTYLFYFGRSWMVGSQWGTDIGWLKAYDAATYPHNVKAVWQISDGKGGWPDAPTIKARRIGKGYQDGDADDSDSGLDEDYEEHRPKQTRQTKSLAGYYPKLTSACPGLLLVINNFTEPSFGKNFLRGCKNDEQMVLDFFEGKLGFRLFAVKRDVTAKKLQTCLENCQEHLNTGSQSFNSLFVVILSHGNKNGILMCSEDKTNVEKVSRGIDKEPQTVSIPVEDIVQYFKGDKVKALRGKPKVFMVDACRGKSRQKMVKHRNGVCEGKAVNEYDDSSSDEDADNSKGPAIRTPVDADILIHYATAEGSIAWINDDGSWFTKAAIDIFKSNYTSTNLLNMMTMINEAVSKKYKQVCRCGVNNCSCSPKKLCERGQMSALVSTLTKKFSLQ